MYFATKSATYPLSAPQHLLDLLVSIVSYHVVLAYYPILGVTCILVHRFLFVIRLEILSIIHILTVTLLPYEDDACQNE